MTPPPPSPLQGPDVSAPGISEFQSDEFSGSQINPQICLLPINPSLKKRKVYAFVYATGPSGTDFYFKAHIVFKRNQQTIGNLPLSIGNGSGNGARLSATLATIAVTGGVNFNDSLGISISAPVNGTPATALLMPQYINGVADSASVSVDELWNVTYYRIYFAVMSSN